MNEGEPQVNGIDRLLLWTWCGACFLATMGLFLYFQMPNIPGLGELAEQPGPVTAVLGSCVVICVAIMVLTERRSAFVEELRHVLLIGTLAAVLGFTAYGTYVYAFSQTLPAASGAPQIGDTPPDFSVTDPEGRTYALANHIGAPVLLVFYRGQW